MVDKEFGGVVFEGRGVKGLCKGFSSLLLEYGGKFFVFVRREEIGGLISRSTGW